MMMMMMICSSVGHLNRPHNNHENADQFNRRTDELT